MTLGRNCVVWVSFNNAWCLCGQLLEICVVSSFTLSFSRLLYNFVFVTCSLILLYFIHLGHYFWLVSFIYFLFFMVFISIVSSFVMLMIVIYFFVVFYHVFLLVFCDIILLHLKSVSLLPLLYSVLLATLYRNKQTNRQTETTNFRRKVDIFRLWAE